MCANDPSPQTGLPPGADLFRAAFEPAPVGMALLAGDGTLLKANAAFAELLGCGDMVVLAGRQYLDFVNDDDRGRCREAWARLCRNEVRSVLLEQGYVGCVGDEVRARVSFAWAGEAPAGCLLVQVVDVTARKSAGLQLSLLSLALDRMQEAAFLIDEHGRFHYVNDQACQSLGYSREELLTMAVPDIDPDWRYERYRQTWPSFRVRGSLTLETRHRAKDGTLRRVEVTANYFEHDGRAYNLALAQDIGERKRVEAALRQSERRYREIFENASDALFLLEVTSDYRFRNLAMNPAFERSVGMSRDRLVGRFVEDTVPAETARAVIAKYRRCLVLGAPVDEEIELDLPSGRRAYHSTLIPVYDPALGRFHRIVGITRDVTLRRQHERVLEERGELERRLSHFAACAPGLMYTCRMRPDGSFHFPYASPGIERLFAIPPDSVAEDMAALDAVLHADDQPCLVAAARDSALTLLPFHLEFRANHPARGCLWVEARAAPERMPDGSTLWHGFMHDITERKRMEAAAEIHRSWLRTLIQTIPDPVWVKSPEGVFLACNDAFGRLYAVDEAGLVGKTDFDYVAPELAAFFQEMDRQAIASGGPRVNEEWVRYAADGRQALWETIKTPLYDASGRVTGVLGVARDITERKRLEDELREKDGYQRALLDNFPFMVWLKDTESRFLAVNQPFADVAGVDSSDAVLGKTDLDFFPADLAMAYRSDDREVLRLKRQKVVEEQIADRGVRKCFETYKAPVEVDGKLLGTVGFARDITQRKLMEEQLRASERQFRMLAENSPSFIVRYDRDARRTYVNPAYLRESGLSAEQAVSLELDVNWCGSPSADEYKACLEQVLQTGVPAELLLDWEARDGRLSNYAINLVAECGADGLPDGVLAIGHNITALVRQERLEKCRLNIFERLACGAPLAEILQRVVEYVEKARPGLRGSIMLADADGKRLLSGPAPSLPADYRAAVDGITIGEGVGSCGTAAWRGETVVVEDVFVHPYWARYRELARAAGIAACCSEPIFASSGKVLGTFCIYGRRPARPSPDDVELVRQASHLAAIAIERTQANELLREREWQFRTLTENLPDHVIRFDCDGRPLYINPQACKDFGLPVGRDVQVAFIELARRRALSDDPSMNALRQAFEKGLPNAVEARWTTEAGERIFDVRHIPEHGENGAIVSVLNIARDITALKEAELRLRESRDLLRELSARRETAREEERKRIAREIHDELGQHLTALRMGISVLRFQFGRRNQALAERVTALMALADKSIQVVRDVATTLRPAALDMGLPAALEWLVAEFGRHTGIPCQLSLPDNEPELAEDRATAVFRVVQESLTNVARHSAASQVTVTLECGADGLLLEVSDNGHGFDPAAAGRDTYGLLSMRERGLMLGGDVAIVSAPGAGTSVRMTVPVLNAAEAE